MIEDPLSGTIKIMLTVCGILIAIIVLFIIQRFSKNPKVHKVTGRILVIIIVLSLLTAGVLIFKNYRAGYYDDEPKAPPFPTYATLDATVLYQGDSISITNNNTYQWSPSDHWGGYGIRFRINDDFDYYYNAFVLPKDTLKIKLLSFTNEKGLRFPYLFYKVKEIQIATKESVETYSFN